MEETRNEQEKKTLRHEDKAASATKMHVRDNRIVRFLLEAYYELRYRVTWHTFQEARNMTIVVIMLSAAVGAHLVRVDFVLNHLFLLLTRSSLVTRKTNWPVHQNLRTHVKTGWLSCVTSSLNVAEHIAKSESNPALMRGTIWPRCETLPKMK